MNANLRNTRRWSTSSFCGTTAPSPLELSELKEQLDECNRSRGRLLRLRTAVEAARRFMASRVITTLAFLLLCTAAALALRSAWPLW